MKVLKTREELNQIVDSLREQGKTIGLVPTMGALHRGHVALVETSVRSVDTTIVSVFVNPIQFNNPEDLDKYPRDLEGDFEKLNKAGCNYVFVPSVEEMYPEKPNKVYSFDGIDECMEGEFRPGHFQGVATVVHLLFEYTKCNKAFFGQKDFQQLAIVCQMTKLEGLDVEVVGCPTVREEDGLAMSSRNLRLSKDLRPLASTLYKALDFIKANARSESPNVLKEKAKDIISNESAFRLEYIDIVDDTYLRPAVEFEEGKSYVACLAAWLGDVRLIDNVKIFS
ncbi:MAG: pantoate--beta-alanine ligase [Bacteroidales bacterium]